MTKAVITVEAINAELLTFETNRDALRSHAHTIACMIFKHIAPTFVSDDCNGTGDSPLAMRLIEKLPTSWAVQMIAWFKDVSPVTITISARGNTASYSAEYKALEKTHKGDKDALEAARKTFWNIERAMNVPFYDIIEEDKVKAPFDYKAAVKMIKGLVSRLEKEADKEGTDVRQIKSIKGLAHAVSTINVAMFEPEPAKEAANANDGDVVEEIAA